jgi:5-methylcytosine-specific restriction endonuclease McrA
LKDEKLRRDPTCQACGEKFEDYRNVELSHVRSKGAGGAFRDDSPGNTVLMHAAANRDQGSMDLETYLRTKWKIEICKNVLGTV